MSKWHEAGKDDIELDPDEREVNIFAGDDDYGNNYVTLTFDQIKEIAAKIESIVDQCKHGMPLQWNCNACSDSGDDPRKQK